MKYPQQFVGLQIRYLPPTNTKPSRIKVINCQTGSHITKAIDYTHDHIEDQIGALLKENGIQPQGGLYFDNPDKDKILVINWSDFERLGKIGLG